MVDSDVDNLKKFVIVGRSTGFGTITGETTCSEYPLTTLRCSIVPFVDRVEARIIERSATSRYRRIEFPCNLL